MELVGIAVVSIDIGCSIVNVEDPVCCRSSLTRCSGGSSSFKLEPLVVYDGAAGSLEGIAWGAKDVDGVAKGLVC